MPKTSASTAHLIPKSGRIASTFDKQTFKAIRKLGIDLEISDNEVVHLAVAALIERYYSATPEEIAKHKWRHFIGEWPPKAASGEEESEPSPRTVSEHADSGR